MNEKALTLSVFPYNQGSRWQPTLPCLGPFFEEADRLEQITLESLASMVEERKITLLSQEGEEVTWEKFEEDTEEGYHAAYVSMPVTNTIVYEWAVSLNSHRRHHGFDAGTVVEAIAHHEKEDESDFIESLSDQGGQIVEVI